MAISKRSIVYVAFLAISLTAIPFIRHLYQEHRKEQLGPDIGLQKAVQRINKLSPKKIDDFVQIDSAAILPNRILLVKYRLLQVLKEDVDEEKLPSFIDALKAESMTKLAKDEHFLEARAFNVVIRQSYHDSRGRHLFDIDVGGK